MKLKVCGMTDPLNLRAIIEANPDYIGFILYERSPRFCRDLHLADEAKRAGVATVAVTVNMSAEEIERLQGHFDYIQLHGSETAEECRRLNDAGFGVIKAINIDTEDSLRKGIEQYGGAADILLFDTKCTVYGGSGMKFDWSILSNGHIDVPFMLSGGISERDMDEIKEIACCQPKMIGVDINSKFELRPGIKDASRIINFAKLLKRI